MSDGPPTFGPQFAHKEDGVIGVTGQRALPCKTVFGEVRGSEIIELVERTTGDLCPCKRGLVCPLLPTTNLGATA